MTMQRVFGMARQVSMTRVLSLREFAKRERANSWQSKGKFAFKFVDCHAVFAKQLVMISAKSTLFKKVKFKRIKNSAQFYRQTFAFDFIPIFAHLLLFLMVLR